MIIIGIDPGVKTGIAVWDTDTSEFAQIKTCGILEAMETVNDWRAVSEAILIIEDARKRKWFGNNSSAKRMGAGSIKRDCKIWQEYCDYHNLQCYFKPPSKGMTKWDSDKFKVVTGWQRRTSEHARDAALLVWKLSEKQAQILCETK